MHWLKTTRTDFLTVLGTRSLKLVLLGQSQGVSWAALPLEALGENPGLFQLLEVPTFLDLWLLLPSPKPEVQHHMSVVTRPSSSVPSLPLGLRLGPR